MYAKLLVGFVVNHPRWEPGAGSLAHDRRLRSDSYDSQRPLLVDRFILGLFAGVRECGDELNFPITYPDLRLDYKVATHPDGRVPVRGTTGNQRILQGQDR